MTIRVLLADDQDLVRSGFNLLLSLEDDIEVVAEARNGQEALEKAVETQPDVILMDVQMPALDGIAATACISNQIPDARVLILTTFDREDYLFGALEAGASGFLLKTADSDELVDAIRKVADGLGLLAPEMTLPLIQRFTADDRQENAPQLSESDAFALSLLTPRERETLTLLARGLTNAEIAAELFLGAATVKTHVSNILAKTHSRDRIAAVIFAHRVGITG